MLLEKNRICRMTESTGAHDSFHFDDNTISAGNDVKEYILFLDLNLSISVRKITL